MKTKEAILEENHLFFGMHQDNNEDEVLKAMDEYAKALLIKYAEWIGVTLPEGSVENFLQLIEQP